MKRFSILIAIVLLAVFTGCHRSYETTELNIIPNPAFMMTKEGKYTLNSTTQLTLENLGQNSPTAKYVARSLRKMHFVPTFSGNTDAGGIKLRINDTVNSEIGEEGYLLEVATNGITISSNTETGLFYGYQTLLQMLPADINVHSYRNISIPTCTVLDYPRFEWRGCQFDVTRHFFSVEEVKRVLDVMSLYKMNKLVLNVGDDYGWRLESEKYPLLNSVSSWRPDRSKTPWDQIQPAQPDERKSYGGYYTKNQIVDLVDYASQLHIEIIPQIALPLNCAALLAAYPHLSCNHEQRQVQCGPNGPECAAICVGNDSVIANVERILDEVASMFPGKYIHLGGQELSSGCWEQCPRCLYRINSNSLSDECQLQSWFASAIAEHFKEEGRQIIVWDALSNEALSSDVAVMAYSDISMGVDAAKSDHDVIMCMSDYCSFDRYQADADYQPKSLNGMADLHKVYDFDPVPAGTNSYLLPHIKGGQCMLFTEYVNTPEELEYMLLPRLCAMAEDLWSPKAGKDWHSFRYRVEPHKNMLTAHGFNVCPGSFKPIITKQTTSQGTYRVSFETEVMNTYVFFTIDGTDPTESSQIYMAPIKVMPGTTIKTLSVYDGKKREGIYQYNL